MIKKFELNTDLLRRLYLAAYVDIHGIDVCWIEINDRSAESPRYTVRVRDFVDLISFQSAEDALKFLDEKIAREYHLLTDRELNLQ